MLTRLRCTPLGSRHANAAFAGVLLLVAFTAACGGAQPSASSNHSTAKKIDRADWTAALVKLGSRSNPNLDELVRLTRENCKASEDDLALQLTMQGSQPAMLRVDIKYVCPDQLPKFDRAQAQADQAAGEATRLCNTPRGQLSKEDAEKAAAIC